MSVLVVLPYILVRYLMTKRIIAGDLKSSVFAIVLVKVWPRVFLFWVFFSLVFHATGESHSNQSKNLISINNNFSLVNSI